MPIAPPSGVRVTLLGQFELAEGDRPLPVSAAGQRLIALLAVHDRPVRRSSVSGCLWPESEGGKSSQNLRSVLHRLPSLPCGPVVRSMRDSLSLPAGAVVDLHDCRDQVLAMCDGRRRDETTVLPVILPALLFELLPDWYDEWLVVERERHRQLRMHALEALSGHLCRDGNFAAALHAALCAVEIEPLRESAHRRVIEVHLAEANVGEALRHYDLCRRLLDEGLGIPPSTGLQSLVFAR